MVGLFVLILLVLVSVLHIQRQMPRDIVRPYLIGAACIVVLGFVAAVTYTVELNAIYNQPEMDGDATFYLLAGEGVAAGQPSSSDYPAYEYFLAAHLWYGNPLLARLGQLLLLVLAYSYGALGLVRLGHNSRTIAWYSRFISLNGIYFGLVTQLVRDILILVAFALAFLAFASLQSKRGSRVTALVTGLVALALLAVLSNWLLFICLGAALVELLPTVFTRKRSLLYKLLLCATGLAVVGTLVVEREEIRFLYVTNVDQKPMQKGLYHIYGTQMERSVQDPVKSLLGPGLIRPILWKTYFVYSTNCHSFMYWWGTLVWYLLLIQTVPILASRGVSLWKAPGVRFAGVLFLLLLATYSFTFGSGMGMRKRAIFQFLFLLTATSAGVFGHGRTRDRLTSWLPSPTLIRAALVIGLIIVNYLSI